MNLDACVAALEAVLVASARPMKRNELAHLLELSDQELERALAELAERLQRPDRGLLLERVGGGVWLVCKPEFAAKLEAIGRPVKEGPLSAAALETLAIIAYRQPVSRPAIEAVRGVRAEAAVAALVERGLVAEVGRADTPGRAILYGTTEAFLLHFGLNSPDDLPPLPEPEAMQLDAELNGEVGEGPTET
ncbi:MAG TPA: SMC-Scp complex subunit ScpB [Limnochordia bacterium]|nr:SMC-Scp complex subunit ScpB [Limnochordia bacterium]